MGEKQLKLAKNIFKVFKSSAFMTIGNMAINLFLPFVLSVAAFGEYKLYTLYLTYLGIFHFGYTDGIFIKYGGENMEVHNQDLRKEHTFLILFLMPATLMMIIIALYLGNIMLLLIALSIIPTNIWGFHRLLLLATGKFSTYAQVSLLFSVANLLLLISLLILDAVNPLYYMAATLLAYLITVWAMERHFYQVTPKTSTSKPSYYPLFKVGIFIMAGNFAFSFFSTSGALIANYYFSIEEFAQYSFSLSILGMIILATSAIGLTLYNYLAKNENEQNIILIKKVLIILGVLSCAAYFFIEVFVTWLLPAYNDSLELIALSFVRLPYFMVINVIIINLYKVKKQEVNFFLLGIIMLVMNLSISLIFTKLFHSLAAITFATTLSYIVWFFYCISRKFAYLKSSLPELMLLIIHFVSFLFCSIKLPSISGLLFYLIINVPLLLLVYYKPLRAVTRLLIKPKVGA